MSRDFGGIILTDLDTALNNLKGHVDEGTLGEIEKMFKDTEGQSARAI